jgi:putative membrane protein
MGVSIFVFVAVVILNKKILPVPETIPSFVYSLPKLNAFINGTCSLLLLLSLYMIKQKNIEAHKKINIITFILSSLLPIIGWLKKPPFRQVIRYDLFI